MAAGMVAKLVAREGSLGGLEPGFARRNRRSLVLARTRQTLPRGRRRRIHHRVCTGSPRRSREEAGPAVQAVRGVAMAAARVAEARVGVRAAAARAVAMAAAATAVAATAAATVAAATAAAVTVR